MKKIRHQNENDNNYDIYDLNLKDKIGKNTGVNKDEIKKEDSLISFSSEDIDEKLNRIIDAKKKEANEKKLMNEPISKIEEVNKNLRPQLKKRVSKNYASPKKTDKIINNNTTTSHVHFDNTKDTPNKTSKKKTRT